MRPPTVLSSRLQKIISLPAILPGFSSMYSRIVLDMITAALCIGKQYTPVEIPGIDTDFNSCLTTNSKMPKICIRIIALFIFMTFVKQKFSC